MSKRILAYVHAYVGHGRNAGAESTLHDLLKSMVAAGWEANVVLAEPRDGTDPNPPYYIDGVFVRTETGGETLLEAAAYTDVMISHLDCSERTTYVAERYGKAMVQLIHNTMWQTEGYIANGADLLIYNTEWVKNYHEGNESPVAGVPKVLERGADTLFRVDFIMVPDRKTTKIPGIVLHPQIDPFEYRVADGPRDHITLINLFENKGPHVFWELAKRYPAVQFLGVLGGYGEQVIPTVVPDNVCLIENTPEMKDVYRLTRAVLMPSMYESFGRVAIEAAASGIPTIHSETPGLLEALQHPLGWKSGLMVDRLDHDNYDIWGDAVEAVLDGAYYTGYRQRALQTSGWWDKKRKEETQTLLDTMEKMLPGI